MLAALGQHDSERPARDLRVLEEQFVEIAHPVEQQAVRIGGLDLHVLRHHRRHAGVRAAVPGRRSTGRSRGAGRRPGMTSALVAKPAEPFILSYGPKRRMWTSLEERAHQCLKVAAPSGNAPHQKKTRSHDRHQRPTRRNRPTFTDQEALQFHAHGRPGKLEVVPTKPMATQRDLSLAYSPGVAVPVSGDRRGPVAGLRLHHPLQHGRGDLQRHRRSSASAISARSRQSR